MFGDYINNIVKYIKSYNKTENKKYGKPDGYKNVNASGFKKYTK